MRTLKLYFSLAGSSPFGVSPRRGFNSRLMSDNPRDYDLDSFSASAFRHTYYGIRAENEVTAGTGSAVSNPPTNARSGVRLRARQVLCHRCKAICNDKGENVQRRGGNLTRRRGRAPEEQNPALLKRRSLVPKIRRLDKSVIEKYSPELSRPPIAKRPLRIKFSNLLNNGQVSTAMPPTEGTSSIAPELRRNSGSEGPMDNVQASCDMMPPPPAPKAPVLKVRIRGTILKISRSRANGDSDEENSADRLASSKAAKKALKRAKRDAQRRMASPARASPRTLGFRSPIPSPKYFDMSPAGSPHGLASRPSPLSQTSIPKPLPTPAYSAIPFASIKRKKKKRKRKKSASDEKTGSSQQRESDEIVNSCLLADGSTLAVNDVVWGQLREEAAKGIAPKDTWWPAKV